jgi:hypothetical protein
LWRRRYSADPYAIGKISRSIERPIVLSA